MNTRAYGKRMEDHALQYLKQHGLTLIQRNYQTRTGEIDLIMQDQDTLVFVEVRMRKSESFGSALESVTPWKQRKIARTADLFLIHHPRYQNSPCRFDIIGVKNYNNTLEYDWLKHAFTLDEIAL